MSGSTIANLLRTIWDSPSAHDFIERLGWTLLHSLWQATLVAAVLAVLLHSTRHRSAHARYLMATIALLVIVALAPITFFSLRLSRESSPRQMAWRSPASRMDLPRGVKPSDDPRRLHPVESEMSLEWNAGQNSSDNEEIAADVRESRVSPTFSAAPLGMSENRQERLEQGGRLVWWEWLESWLGTFVLCWALGVLCFSLRPAIGWWAVRQYARHGIVAAPEALVQKTAALVRRLGIDRATRVVVSHWIDVPVTIGWIAPMILVPESLVACLTLPQWEAILAHECAHIRRRDYLVNLLQMIVETFWFHHPAVWWVSRTMRRLREECCDDLALSVIERRIDYARALMAVEQHRSETPVPALSFRGGTLMARIQRVMGREPERGASLWWFAPALVVLGVMAGAWLGSVRGGVAADPGPAVAPAVAEPRPEAAPVLWLRDLAGKPTSGTVVAGRVGFGEGIDRLSDWSAKADGVVVLEGLAKGRHSLVAWLGQSAVPVVVESPTRAEPIVVPARQTPEWYGFKDLAEPEIRTTVEENKEGAFLRLEITNRADKPLSIDIRDVCLTTPNWRIFPPAHAWSGERIWPPHSTRVARLSWSSIVREGLWLPRREPISEPWPAQDETETHRYVRVVVGNRGTLPVLVPRPDRVLASLLRAMDSTKTEPSVPKAMIEGQIRFTGTRPAETRVTFPKPDLEAWTRDGRRGDSPHRPSMPQLHFHEFYCEANIVEESVVVGDQGGLADVLVWLRNRKGSNAALPPPPDGAPKVSRLEVKEGRLSPRVMAFLATSELEIANLDAGILDVGAEGLTSDPFRRMVKSKEMFRVSLRPERLPIRVSSRVAPWMSAFVLPLNHSFHAATGRDGRFKIEQVPEGEWELVFWHGSVGWLKSDKVPTGRLNIQVTKEKIDLGVLKVGPEALELPESSTSTQTSQDVAPRAVSSQALLPLGNAAGIPQLAARRAIETAKATPPGNEPPAGAPRIGEGEWRQAEYGTEYRFDVVNGEGRNGERRRYAADELPLLKFEIRNHGGPQQEVARNLGWESHPSRHRLLVDGVAYERRDQPWGGLDRLQVGGESASFSVLLSPDWQSASPENPRPLKLEAGKHRVALQVTLHEFERRAGEEGVPQTTLRPGGERSIVTQAVDFEVEARPTVDPRATALKNMELELALFPRFHAAKVTQNLRRLVLENRPASIERVLTLVRDGTMDAPDPASSVFASLWDSLTRDERQRYLQASMTSFALTRPAYPADVDAAIAVGVRFRSDYAGLPSQHEITSETMTTVTLDGEPNGELFRYPLHTTVSHWIRTGTLRPGRHTIRLVSDYIFRDQGEEYRGRVESREYEFEVVPKQSPPASMGVVPTVEMRQQFAAQFQVLEKIPLEKAPGRAAVDAVGPETDDEPWQPTIRWNAQGAEPAWGLRVPLWRVAAPLDFDLCFRVEWVLEKTGATIPCSDLILPAGQMGVGHFYPITEHPAQLRKLLVAAADEEGFVSLRVRLNPSYESALTRPQVSRYYDALVTSELVKARMSTKARR